MTFHLLFKANGVRKLEEMRVHKKFRIEKDKQTKKEKKKVLLLIYS